MNGHGYSVTESQYIRRYHEHSISDNQCSSAIIKHIRAPVDLVSPSVCVYSVLSALIDVLIGYASLIWFELDRISSSLIYFKLSSSFSFFV